MTKIICSILGLAVCLVGFAARTPESGIRFVDSTRKAGIHFVHHTGAAGKKYLPETMGSGCAFIDYDNDGWPDLLLVNGHVYPEVDKYKLGSEYEEPRLLYHNTGKGSFEDISKVAGAGINTAASGRGLAIGDLWNNGTLPVSITNMGTPVTPASS